MKVTKDILYREIAGEHILIPVGQTALKVQGMMTLTESGKLLFDLLQKGSSEPLQEGIQDLLQKDSPPPLHEGPSEEDLVNLILQEYDIDPETARRDVQIFLRKLDAIGILSRGGE